MNKPLRLVDQLADQLETMISSQQLPSGARLPAERQLAGQLDVSRTSLREAIQKLVSRGVLESRPGGGTFVRTPARQWRSEVIVDPLTELFQQDPEYRFDVLEIRHALEASAAWHAAQRATEDDKLRIRQHFERMLEASASGGIERDAHADAAFHLAIAEAAHNLVLLQVMRGLFDLLLANVSQNLSVLYGLPRVSEQLASQHRELMDAIVDGDPERARNAALQHLEYVHSTLRREQEDQARRERSHRLPGRLTS